jgi:hypothetical protein
MRKVLLLLLFWPVCASLLPAQKPNPRIKGPRYLLVLEDARLDLGVKMTSVFALDDRAPLSANPHFQAMWNLVKLGASLEALLQGMDEPLSNLEMGEEFGRNGYNKTVPTFFISLGFGETSDLQLQQQFIELAVGPGYFREGGRGTNLHLDYRFNFAKTQYGAGGGSLARPFDYEAYIGLRTGFDWSFQRSESEAGFFQFLNGEIERIASENEFTANQLIALEQLAEDSKVLLPEDVGGRAFHIGPIAGLQLSRNLFSHARLFANAQFFYDLMDLSAGRSGEENRRSQHNAMVQLGIEFAIGGEGQRVSSSFY